MGGSPDPLSMICFVTGIFQTFKTKYIHRVRLRGPVIQANGRLIFEDDLRSGGLLGFTTLHFRTGLADSMVTLGEPGDG